MHTIGGMEALQRFVVQAFYWESVLTSALHSLLFALVVWLLTRYADAMISRKWRFWVILTLGAFLLLGVWGSQSHHTTRQVGADFRLEVVDYWFGGVGDGDAAQGTLVMFNVAVTNVGSPSIITNWHCYANLPNTGEKEMVVNTSPSIVIGDRELGSDDLIFGQHRAEPLTRGSRVRGDLPCELRGVPPSHFMQPGVKLRVMMGDAYGNEYTQEVPIEPPFSGGPIQPGT